MIAIGNRLADGFRGYFNEDHSWFLEEFEMKVLLENGEVEFIFQKK